MSYSAYVCQIKNLRNHPNGDKLYLGECFGNTVAVSRDGYYADMVGVYFPTDGQLSLDFCLANNLLRKLPDGTPSTGYMDPDKRNVTSIRLRGEKSDGLFLPLTCLASFGDISTLKIGDTITTFNGKEICQKYVPYHATRTSAGGAGTRAHRRAKRSIAPQFYEHADTEQLAYNMEAFKPGDELEITLKMHGTSQRTGYLNVFQGFHSAIPWVRWVLEHCNPDGKIYNYALKYANDFYDWGYVSGTRRTVLENYEGGYYGSNEFREKHSKIFEGKLWKGETVYYEVVGFTHTGAPIMASASNSKLNDKEFVKRYGKETTFSYGCSPDGMSETRFTDLNDLDTAYVVEKPQSDIYVYRMTMTNEDGQTVEYTPEFMRYRCEQMGIKTVPVFAKVYIKEDAVIAHHADGRYSGGNLPKGVSIGEAVKMIAEEFYDGPDPVGKTHVREGVVVRIVNRPKFTAYKHKNFAFKCLEGIVKVEATAPDMEEQESLAQEE